MSSWLVVGIVLPLIIGMMGEVFKNLVLVGPTPKGGWLGWRGVYFVTYKFHALIVGGIFGFFMFISEVPWPIDVFGKSLGSAVLAGTFAGGVAMVGYQSIVGTIRNSIENLSLKKTAKEEIAKQEDSQ